MKRVEYMLALSVVALFSDDALADGGIMRAHEVQGPFVVTIFTASEPQQGRPVDVSVMVQERDSNDAILDATVKLILTPPAGSLAKPVEEVCGTSDTAGFDPNSDRFTVAATRQRASNKLLYAAPIKLDVAGNWQLRALIQREGDLVKIACSLPVSPPPRKLIGLLPYLLLPPLMVALFTVNQWLRGQLLEKLPHRHWRHGNVLHAEVSESGRGVECATRFNCSCSVTGMTSGWHDPCESGQSGHRAVTHRE